MSVGGQGATRLAVVAGALAVIIAAAAVGLPRPESDADRVTRLASELRCVVCQGLSVNDSPSESAREMRALIARRVGEGRSDEEIRAEFRDAYGEWIFLSPPAGDARALIWLAPLAAIAAGALFAASRLRTAPAGSPPSPQQLALLRERARLAEDEP